MKEESGTIRWRPHWFLRVLVVSFAAISTALAVDAIVDSFGTQEWPWSLVAIPLFVGPAFLLWRMAISTYVELQHDVLLVRNPFRRLTVSLSDIEGCEPGYWGLRLRLRDKRSIQAMAIQKTNTSAWLGRETEADRICGQILDASKRSGT